MIHTPQDWSPMLVVCFLIVFFAVLPARWDPAIQLKEYNIRVAKRRTIRNGSQTPTGYCPQTGRQCSNQQGDCTAEVCMGGCMPLHRNPACPYGLMSAECSDVNLCNGACLKDKE